MSRPGINAIASRLAAASVNFSPRSLSIGEGLRAAAACASMVAAAGVFHAPSLSWAAIGALWTCLADPGGLTSARFRAMAGFTVLSSAFAVLASGAAAQGWGLAAALVFLCSFFGTMVRVYGGEAAQVGTLAVVACVVAVDRPAQSLVDLAGFAATYTGGCLWAMLLTLSIWRIHPYQAARDALATTLRALAAMVTDLAEPDRRVDPSAWGEFAKIHRTAVRAGIEKSRSILERITRERHLSVPGRRLIVIIEVADRIFAHLIALSDRLERLGVDPEREAELEVHAFRRLAAILDGYAIALRRGAVTLDVLEPAAADLLASAHEIDGPAADGLLAIAEQIHLLAYPGIGTMPTASNASDVRGVRFAPLMANVTWRSADLRHALRCAVTVSVVVLMTHLLGLPYAYWMAMAVILVQQPSIATTWLRAGERVVGSTLGGALAALLGLELHSPLALTVAVFPLAALTLAVRSINYSLFVLFLTPLFVLVVDLTQPGANELHLAAVRAVNNVAGGIVALAGCLVLWPSWEPKRLPALIADAIEANGRYASLAFSGDADERALDGTRRAAGLASSNAEAARERSALEAWWMRDALEDALAVLVLVRGLAGIATGAWLGQSDAVEDGLTVWLQDESSALSAWLREGTQDPVSPVTPQPNGDGARAVQQMALLRAAVGRFVSAQSG
jgi:uncharacterized membrane protein YccC